jgi:hypothetical protein
VSSKKPKDDPDELKQRITASATARLRAELGREPEPEELAAALAVALGQQRASLIEDASPDAARIAKAEDANKPNAAATAGSSRFDDCKVPAQWTEPARPKGTTTVHKINEANRAKWAEPESNMIQVVMAADQAESERALATAKAAAEVRVGKAVSDFQSDHARKPRPKKEPTHKSEVIAAMSLWRADNHTLAEFLDAAEVGSIPSVNIKLAPLVDANKYIVVCENVSDHVQAPSPTASGTQPPAKTVRYRTLEHWWEEASSK